MPDAAGYIVSCWSKIDLDSIVLGLDNRNYYYNMDLNLIG